jgi:predicted permease
MQDFRFAWRQLLRAPGFALAAILTLALGTGANTSIFALINNFTRPLPVPDADRIVVLAADFPGDDSGLRYRFSYPALQDFREQAEGFSDIAGFTIRLAGLTAGGRTSQFLYHGVSGNFFTGLGLHSARGRLFLPGEGEHPGAEPIVVLGYALWQTRFGGDEAVLDSIVRIDGVPMRVIGVAPPRFHGVLEGLEIDGYLPLGAHTRTGNLSDYFDDRSLRTLTLIGRLEPGVSLARAQQSVDLVARRVAADHPATDRDLTVRVMPEPDARPMPIKFLFGVMPVIQGLLFALAAVVLLIACVNVANLLIVRGSIRQRELAVRAALGADRFRLMRLLLAESLLLAGVGGAAGLLLGWWASAALMGTIDISAGGLPIRFGTDIEIDGRVLGYAVAVAAGTGLLVGLVPALRISRRTMAGFLHDGGRAGSTGAGRLRLRGALVVAQVAGSLMLLIIAGLFVRSLQRAESLDLGFEPDHLLNVRMDPSQVGYDAARAVTFYDELDRRVRALPAVESTSYAFTVPVSPIFWACPVEAEGAPSRPGEAGFSVGHNLVSPRYFDTMRLPIVRGRAFAPSDTADATPVVIVNETLAGRLWPNQDPIGKRLLVRCRSQSVPWQVVGVARNSKYFAVFEQELPFFYLSQDQAPSTLRVLQVRSAMAPDRLAAAVRREIDALDPEIPPVIETMSDGLNGALGFFLYRFGSVQATAMGVTGLLLGVVGLYGLVSYTVRQREREIGIRLALGARPAHVYRLVLAQGVSLVAAGVLIGIGAAVLVARAIGHTIFIVNGADPLTLMSVSALLCAVALAACYIPARRALRVDPIATLRQE